MPTLRVRPSSDSASARSSATSSSAFSRSASSGSIARAWAMVTCLPGWKGISLAMPSTKPYGRSSTRPTSRTAAFAAIVPNVAICDTLSVPYLCLT